MMLSHFLLALCLITAVKSEFHPDCATKDALSNRRCCPVFEGSVCGSSSGRGSCVQYQLYDPDITDTRCNFPYQLYDEMCICNENYDGADCGDCKSHYHGPTCSEFVPCVRQEFREYTAAQKKQFIDAVCKAKTTTSTRWVAQTGGIMGDVSTYTFETASEYDCMAAIHANSAININQGDKWTDGDVLHRGPAFCPGHRCLLLRYERMLQQVSGNKSLCLPYWDWTKDGDTCAVCTGDLMGEVGPDGRILAPSCLANWRTVCGDSDTNSFCRHDPDPSKWPRLTREYSPTKSWSSLQHVQQCVRNWLKYDTPPYDQSSQGCFRACLEGSNNPATGQTDGYYMHILGHVGIGGDMSSLLRAASDPIFYCHHAQIDRICAMWQKENCKTPDDYPSDDTPPCQGPNDGVYPIMPRKTFRDCMKSPEELGYSYSDGDTWVDGCSNSEPRAAPPTTTSTTTSTTTRTTTRTTTKTTKDCGFLCWLG